MQRNCRSLFLLLFASLLAQAATTYSFNFFEACPGCSTGTGGINNAGTAAAVSAADQGYLYNGSSSVPVIYPGSAVTVVTVPHNNGRVPGAWLNSTGVFQPLVREPDGSFTTYSGYPGSTFTWFLELNEAGDAVGYYALDPSDPTSIRGFVRSANGTYSSLSYPAAGANDATVILGWNEAGTMVGYSGDLVTSTNIGVIRTPDGVWQSLLYPGSDSTMIWGINNPGTVVGGYRDASGWHPFLYSAGMFQSLSVPGYSNAAITGINDFGVLVGNTIAPGSNVFGGPQTGFIATAVPEPSMMFVLAPLFLIGHRQIARRKLKGC